MGGNNGFPTFPTVGRGRYLWEFAILAEGRGGVLDFWLFWGRAGRNIRGRSDWHIDGRAGYVVL